MPLLRECQFDDFVLHIFFRPVRAEHFSPEQGNAFPLPFQGEKTCVDTMALWKRELTFYLPSRNAL